MEDGNLIESQKSIGGEKRQKVDVQVAEGGETDGGRSGTGVLIDFISSFGGGGGEAKAEDDSLETRVELVKEEEKGKRNGILDELISDLASPRTPTPIDVEVYEAKSDSEEVADTGGDDEGGENGGEAGAAGGGGGGGGSVFNNLISNFLHQKEGETPGVNGKGSEVRLGFGSGTETVKATTGPDQQREGEDQTAAGTGIGTGSRSIIDNIVSRFPTENQAPAPDEASILIHSVVHD